MPEYTEEPVYGLNIVIIYAVNDSNPGDILCQMGPVASPQAPPARLVPGTSLYSPARGFRLTLQGDGNAVLQYVQTSNLPHGWPNRQLASSDVSWVPVWATGTNNKGVTHLDMQYDGNLVAYNASNQPVWASNTNGNNQAFLRLQDDGNLVITNQQGNVVWASNTSAGEATGAYSNWPE
jgi:D-mannose binding lectin